VPLHEARVVIAVMLARAIVACEPAATNAPLSSNAQAAPDAAPPEAPEDRAARDACERFDDVNACMRAGQKNTVVGHALLYHGCMTGSRAACQALHAREVTMEKLRDTDARADVDRALALGCAQGRDAACSLAGSFSDGREEASLKIEAAAQDLSNTEAANRREQCVQRCAHYHDECTSAGSSGCDEAQVTCTKACEPPK
jgi:hypothetical protein